MIGSPFFTAIRASLGKGSLQQSQVDGFNVLSDAWDQKGDGDVRKLAYVFATAWHETAQTMQPIAEIGKGRGKAYGKRDPKTGQVYYGRGYVQLTWDYNYARAGKELGVDLLSNADKAMDPDIAAPIAIVGMLEGWFTTRKLSNYFNDKTNDPVNARRIINGTDRATLVASYHGKFLAALKATA